MGIDIRLPNITASTEREQLVQMKSYLFQLAEQLQWALQNVDTSNNTVVVAPAAKSLAPTVQTPGNAESTFGSIKALIIKSADIVNAYSDEITRRLEGVYVASSDFGEFQEQTSQTILENSQYTDQVFSNVQTIITKTEESFGDRIGELSGEIGNVESKVDGVNTALSSDIKNVKSELSSANSSIAEIKASIKTGIIDEKDGLPIYGVEVWQTNLVDGKEVLNKCARFTAGRLSFYDNNGFEVAYISDYKLFITHAEVTGTLTLGGYLADTTNGLAFKWGGRS